MLIGGAVAVVLLLSGGYYALVDDKRPSQIAATLADKAAQDVQLAAQVQRQKDLDELARLRTENERRLKAEQEAAQRKEIEEETRRKIETEMAKKNCRRMSPAKRPIGRQRKEATGSGRATEGGP